MNDYELLNYIKLWEMHYDMQTFAAYIDIILKDNKQRNTIVANGTLFHCRTIPLKEVNQLKNTDKIIIEKYTTWYKSIDDAKNANPSIAKKDEVKILVKKNILTKDMVIDVDRFVKFFGEKQLQFCGVKITNRNKILIKPITIARSEITQL